MDIKVSTVLTGFYTMGEIANNNPSVMAEVLAGLHDELLSITFYDREHGELPESLLVAKEDAEVQTMLSRLKDYIKQVVSAQFNRYIKEEGLKLQREKHKERIDFLNSFKDSNKPAPEGTTSELAEKYGVSKKQVRRLKRENKLHTLIRGD